MSVSGARRAKELTEKYAKMVYNVREETLVKTAPRSMFCPSCGAYLLPFSKCRRCGFKPDQHQTSDKSAEER